VTALKAVVFDETTTVVQRRIQIVLAKITKVNGRDEEHRWQIGTITSLAGGVPRIEIDAAIYNPQDGSTSEQFAAILEAVTQAIAAWQEEKTP
jgi:hypothetical protein